ncbi:hypothetical protein AB0M43_13100 [Longispora sp. NPDC051575]|uniref:hypothetical protein n=1 Tax=Longispora sp. NPDC051575 TaxID=3154943 RepID=UPI003413BDCB
MKPALDAMLAQRRPKTAINWIGRSKAKSVLRGMALGEIPITHEALDALPRTPTLDHLRDFLITSGVLPAQHVRLERLVPWLNGLLTDLPSEHARIVRPFATWTVLRRARAKADRAPFTQNQAARARSTIRTAVRLLQWLSTQGTTLAKLRQPLLDHWILDCAQNERHYTKAFLRWAHQHRLAAELSITRHPEPQPTTTMHNDDRWTLVTKLLHDDHIALELRICGLFVLLFGQHLSRVAKMTTDQVTDTQTQLQVRFTTEPITMPNPLDTLIRHLMHHRGHSSYPDPAQKWLFPGGFPGRPLTPATLGQRLHQIGIHDTRQARNAAMMHLASEIPAPVLADLLGLDPGRAVAWARLAGRDWASYAANRTPTPLKTNTTQEQ